MYRLKDLRRIGWINIGGGLATTLTGLIAQLIVGFNPLGVLINNFSALLLFMFGWFMFNQIVMASVYNKLVDAGGRAKLTRLATPLETPPAGRWGQSFDRLEIGLMAVWAGSVLVVQLLLGANFTLPMGGLAGGWLAGGGIGRLRFAAKLGQEQTEQQRTFYFTDTALGPRTEIAFYSARPDETQPVGSPMAAASGILGPTVLPPGVKRRAVSPVSTPPPSQSETRSSRPDPK